jgi:hypothetical protein
VTVNKIPFHGCIIIIVIRVISLSLSLSLSLSFPLSCREGVLRIAGACRNDNRKTRMKRISTELPIPILKAEVSNLRHTQLCCYTREMIRVSTRLNRRFIPFYTLIE